MTRGAAAYGSRQVERALPPVGAGPAQHGKAAAWGCGLVVEAMQGRKRFAVEKGGTRGAGKGIKKAGKSRRGGKEAESPCLAAGAADQDFFLPNRPSLERKVW